MKQTLTIRLPRRLAREFEDKARAAKTTPSAVLRRLVAEHVKTSKAIVRNTLQEHIITHAGRWDGYCSSEELLRKTRP
jgi:hypothetical protein